MPALTPEQQKQLTDLIPYINKVAASYAHNPQEVEDFQSAGYYAGCLAVMSWDPAKKSSLKTWLRWYLHQYIVKEYQFHSGPVGVPENIKQVGRYLATNAVGDLSPERLRKFAKARFPEAHDDDIEDAVWFTIRPDKHRRKPLPDDSATNAVGNFKAYAPHRGDRAIVGPGLPALAVTEYRELFDQWVGTLTPRAQQIARLYLLEGLTLREIGVTLGVSHQAVDRYVQRFFSEWQETTKGENHED